MSHCRLTGDDFSSKFVEKVDVEVGRVGRRSVWHEPVIAAAGLVLDFWPDMLLQPLLLVLGTHQLRPTILVHHPPHLQHSPIN